MNFNQTDCVLVLGRRGCGKSFLAKSIQKVWSRKIIIDSLNEYKTGPEHPNRMAVSSFDSFCNVLKKLKENESENFELVFRFDPEHDSNEEIFDEIMRLAYYFKNLQVVIEEVQLYSSPHQLSKWLKNCLLTGRHQGLSLMFTTQRPGELNKTILSQCHHIFCGQIIEGNDLRYISSFLGEKTQALTSFEPRRFLHFGPDGVREFSTESKKEQSSTTRKNSKNI